MRAGVFMFDAEGDVHIAEQPTKSAFMMPEDFQRAMWNIYELTDNDGDLEIAHSLADKLMCKLLRELGYEGGAELFEAMPKWYA